MILSPHLAYRKYTFEFRGTLDIELSTIWALHDFTEHIGATRVAIGSHEWPRYRVAKPEETVGAAMPQGSVVIYNGGLWHGAGANNADTSRWGLNIDYNMAWLRQEENRARARPLSPTPNTARAQGLLLLLVLLVVVVLVMDV